MSIKLDQSIEILHGLVIILLALVEETEMVQTVDVGGVYLDGREVIFLLLVGVE